jgi:hypothetical protein
VRPEVAMMNLLVLVRLKHLADRTLGRLVCFRDVHIGGNWVTLELPDRGNQRNLSRIPAGVYEWARRESPRFGKHIHITSVPDRSWILIHSGNVPEDTRGCILIAETMRDIDGDGVPDIVNSTPRRALHHLLEQCGPSGVLHIIE